MLNSKFLGNKRKLAVIISLLFCSNAYSDDHVNPKKDINQAQSIDMHNNPMQSQITSFEESSLPEFISVSEKSELGVTTKRAVNGNQSLVWNWNSGDTLKINKPFRYYTPDEAKAAYGRSASTVFSIWIYNEKPSDGELNFQFGSTGNSNFTMKLNFTGWRSAGLAFHRDMKGTPASEMKGLTITAPNSPEGGKIYIDRVMVSIDDIRYQWADYQVSTQLVEPEIDYGLPGSLPEVTPEELRAISRIKSNLTDYYLSGGQLSDKKIAKIRKHFEDYKLRKEDGVVNGPHIVAKKQLTLYQAKYLSPQDKKLVDKYVDLRKFTEFMQDVAQVWHKTNDQQLKMEMEAMYLLMSEHLLDQGYQKGSSLVTTHHWGYSTRSWYASMLLMEEPLRQAGLLKPIHDSLLWYSREFKERGFDMKVGPKSSDLDYYNTLSLAHIIMLLLEDDEQERAALMHKFGKFISGNIAQTPPGYADGFRPDGTAFRHKGNYPGYSFSAFRSAAYIAYLLSDTPFELSLEARQNLKKAMLSARIYSNPNPGVGTNGRRPFYGISINKIAKGYRWLALAGTDDSGIDQELAAAYLRVVNGTKKDGEAEFGMPIVPENHPQGAYSFNYAAMGVYRYQDKMVTMKGWNKYVWSSEIYRNANRYGRYQSHGSVQIQKWGDEKQWGYNQNGWDWNRMPGATTIHLPWELLDAPNKHTTMLRNKIKYNGATDLKGKYGAFGFVLQNPKKWPNVIDPSFTAKKSVFSFDNRLILVGSNISNSKDEFATETTLFQYGLTQNTQEMWVNGEKITSFPYEQKLEVGDWLIDGMGNGYYVVEGGDVNIHRKTQQSRDNQDKTPTSGDFATAWIDHGKAPDNAEYEYIVILDATPEKMVELKAKMANPDMRPYNVIRKDDKAHVVEDKESGVTGYTAFGYARISDKWVKSISTSSIVMIKGSDKTLEMSVANPDLNMDKETLSQVVPVSITLNGAWSLAEPMDNVSIKRRGSRTVVTVECKDGLPVQLDLNKV
ncbi:hypothetical protein BIT28_06845 [Photobacterium proteolyticum]|uniref:Chondroitin sulfate ABC lyase n=1 Tax=Photobacterium proteolyticum TaxID=1903952 RepID=A0A1Q9GER7_9GAMM|nr:chondroitinase family polysaccharide lyase [Photobacterium proteolyticum]OLQ72895.1 hypothetical protein BIT28_06845 [Photobacterium proteolyticum]